jgi:hypothetical protein
LPRLPYPCKGNGLGLRARLSRSRLEVTKTP